MPPKSAPPSITEQAFSCPHCGAYTTQYWFELFAKSVRGSDGRKTPYLIDGEFLKHWEADKDIPAKGKAETTKWFREAMEGRVFIEGSDTRHDAQTVTNVHLSKCFACGKVAVWVHKSLIYPPQKSGPEANADAPPDVLRDYEEAQSILELSPRGAAALLRLSIQKLCKHLGEPGGHLDTDIASLVKKGLSPIVQKSLDIVRVIGNEAVHPGTIDLRDNSDTALQLFRVVNLIVEQMISTPKHINDMYGSLPPEKRAAIEKRDGKKS